MFVIFAELRKLTLDIKYWGQEAVWVRGRLLHDFASNVTQMVALNRMTQTAICIY